jgi:hypothetical protein
MINFLHFVTTIMPSTKPEKRFRFVVVALYPFRISHYTATVPRSVLWRQASTFILWVVAILPYAFCFPIPSALDLIFMIMLFSMVLGRDYLILGLTLFCTSVCSFAAPIGINQTLRYVALYLRPFYV